jgi:hypothetical protein
LESDAIPLTMLFGQWKLSSIVAVRSTLCRVTEGVSWGEQHEIIGDFRPVAFACR